MPDYKPSPRSGFPGSGSGGGEDWVNLFGGALFMILGVIGGIYSLSNGFEWWPQGTMFIGGVFGVWYMASKDTIGCFIISFITIALFGLLGLLVRGGWSPWGWIMVGSAVAFIVTAVLMPKSK